jgi:hypothetical protein
MHKKVQMNFSPLKNTIIPILFFLLTQGCIKEEINTREVNNDMVLDVGGAVPLGYADISLADIFDSLNTKETLKEDENGFLSLEYNHELLSLSASELYKFPPYNYSQIVKNPLPANIEPLDEKLPVTIVDSGYIDFGFSGEDNQWTIDSILLLSGTISLDGSLTYNVESTMNIIFPGITKNSNPLKMELLTGTSSATRNLDGYTIALQHDHGPNQLKFHFDFTINATNQTIPPDAELVSFSIGFSAINYETVYGKPEKSSFPFDLNEFYISAFNEMLSGEIYFQDPLLQINTSNSFGAPFGIGITSFHTLNKQDERVSLTGTAMPTPGTPRTFNFPTIDRVGESEKDSLLLTNSGTNLSELLLKLPGKAEIEGELLLLPEDDQQVYFIHRNSMFSARLNLVLPLHGYARDIMLSNNMDFQIDSFLLADRQEIQKVIFRLSYINTFPVDVKTQYYFMSSDFAVIDSLFQEWKTLEGMTTDKPADVENHDEWKYLDIPVDRNKLDKMALATNLTVRTLSSTSGLTKNPPDKVKIYSNQYIKIHIGVIAEIKVDTKEIF